MGWNSLGSVQVSPSYNNCSQGGLHKQRNYLQDGKSSSTVQARCVSEHYSKTSMSFEYTSKDGDSISLSMESVDYSRSLLEVSAQGSQEDVEKVVEYIKNSYDQLKKDILGSFLKSIGADVADTAESEEVASAKPLEIPEYWNAENTSQRIVDFAVSFYGMANGSGEEFLETIKSAIEEGFKQARDLMGDLPEEVSSLVDDTWSLVMEKLDAWAVEQGISSEAGVSA